MNRTIILYSALRSSPFSVRHNLVRKPFSTSTITNMTTSLNWAGKDGSFNRQVSAFRDAIEKGGRFEPEKGESIAPSDIAQG